MEDRAHGRNKSAVQGHIHCGRYKKQDIKMDRTHNKKRRGIKPKQNTERSTQ